MSPSMEVEGGRVKVDGGGPFRGSGFEVDGLRKRMVATHFKGGGVDVDGLRKRTAAVALSEVRDEVTACSKAGIEDGRWWWRCDGF
jgi:hypothetical protein